MELIDLGFNGPRFTWRGTRNNSLVQERLDQGLVNRPWQVQWPNMTVTHEVVKALDHCPLVINTDYLVAKGKRQFRFEGFWAKESGCREVVENSWCNQIGGDWLNKWHQKKRNSKKNLNMWSRETFQDRKASVNHLTELLGSLHLNWSTNFERIKETTAMIFELEKQEEAFWAQRSLVRWLHQHDFLSPFYYLEKKSK